jgi:hypothetical protein
MSILADTNILLRRTQPDHPSHTLAVESVAKLLAAAEPVYFTLQNIAEFWMSPRGPWLITGWASPSGLPWANSKRSSVS